MPQSDPKCPNCQYPLDAPFESDDGTVFVCVPRTDPTPDPLATLELIAELERVAIMHTPPAQATRMWEMREDIIRDLRRLADLEGKAQIGTHAADGSCWDWGRNHYECALRRLAEVEAALKRLEPLLWLNQQPETTEDHEWNAAVLQSRTALAHREGQ